MTEPSKLLNVTQLAVHTGIPKRTIYNMIRDGRFDVTPQKGSDPRKWHIEHVDTWMKSQ